VRTKARPAAATGGGVVDDDEMGVGAQPGYGRRNGVPGCGLYGPGYTWKRYDDSPSPVPALDRARGATQARFKRRRTRPGRRTKVCCPCPS
jgi:hypothetical protein